MIYLFLFIAFGAIGVPGFAIAEEKVTWHGSTEIAVGAGTKGPWQQNASRYHYVDDPTVLALDNGKVAIAWVDQTRKDVFFRIDSSREAERSTPPVNVSRNGSTFSWLPKMARITDKPNRIYVAWQEIIFSGGSHGGEILFSRSDDNGSTFSSPINISRSMGGDGKGRINAKVWSNGSFDLIAGPDGVVYLAWTEYDGPLWFSRSTDGGKSFSAPTRLSPPGISVRAPTFAWRAPQTLYLAWTTDERDGGNISLRRSMNGGISFGPVLPIVQDNGYSDAPSLAVGADGTLHLVFAHSAKGPFTAAEIVHMRSKDGEQFGNPQIISHPLPGLATSAGYPSIATDAAGRLIVLFELFPDPSTRPLGLGMTVSADSGLQFGRPFSVPGSADRKSHGNGSYQGLLMRKMAVTAEGEILVVNSSLQQDIASRVWLMRGLLPQLPKFKAVQ